MEKQKEKQEEKVICCLCGNEIEPVGSWTSGNNAQPLMEGRCCADCDRNKVTPARIRELDRIIENGN